MLLQLAAFPDSAFHDEETTLARESPAIHSVYAGLSGDISFRHYRLIQQRQLYEAAEAWASGGDGVAEHDIEGAVRGKLDAWQDMISVGVPPSDEFAHDLRQDKQKTEETLLPVLEKLAQCGRRFDDVFEEDVRSWGPTVVRQSIAEIQKRMALLSGLLQPSLDDLLPSTTYGLVMAVERGLQAGGISQDDLATKALEFFLGDAPASVPCVRIRSLLFAALVRKMASGQKRPTASIANDFEMIATLLPYCDAMFLDRQCHGLAGENPIRGELEQHRTLLFSKSNQDEFLAYLQQVGDAAPPAHLDRVREVIRESL